MWGESVKSPCRDWTLPRRIWSSGNIHRREDRWGYTISGWSCNWSTHRRLGKKVGKDRGGRLYSDGESLSRSKAISKQPKSPGNQDRRHWMNKGMKQWAKWLIVYSHRRRKPPIHEENTPEKQKNISSRYDLGVRISLFHLIHFTDRRCSFLARLERDTYN